MPLDSFHGKRGRTTFRLSLPKAKRHHRHAAASLSRVCQGGRYVSESVVGWATAPPTVIIPYLGSNSGDVSLATLLNS